jgi:hypothetical protein
MEKRTCIIINGKTMHLVLGKTIKDWEKYSSNEVLWSFQIHEFIEEAIEINEDIWYWLINDRVYETEEEVN